MPDELPSIVVTGYRVIDWAEYLSFRTPRNVDEGGGGDGDPNRGYWDDCQNHPPLSNYPQNFDFQKDAEVDALAKEAAEDIQSAANSDRIEYAVFIWQDNLGGLNRSSLQTANRPSPAYDPAITTPQSMGFDSWSQVVGVLHNHPTLYNAGNETNPIW